MVFFLPAARLFGLESMDVRALRLGLIPVTAIELVKLARRWARARPR
jgi:hypothetical protein